MDGRSFRQESHVAQQSRRDKLRIVEQSSTTCLVDNHHVFPNNLEQLSVHSGINPDLIQVRNVRNGDLHRYGSSTSVFPSEMLNFATTCSNSTLPVEKNAILDQELGLVQSNRALLFTNMSNPINVSTKASSSNDPQGCSSSIHWRNVDSQQSYDWMVNYASGLSVGRESNNQKPIFVGDVLSNNARANNISRNVGYDQDFHLSSNIPSQDCQKQQQFTSHVHYSSLYQNTLQDVVAAQPSALFFENANSWSSSDQLELIARKSDQEGLSLSLASNPQARANVNHFGEGYESNNQDSRNYLCPMSKPEVINRGCGKSVNYSSNYVLQNAGPLGPFTGYATILKSSRFLKPAQDLLDEFCTITGTKLISTSGEVSNLDSVDVVNAIKAGTSPPKVSYNNNNNNNSGVSSSTFYSSNDVSGDVGVASSSCESYKPEYQQRKAKLLYLQEEVCRRYKQYDQQMQMVASSFESVAGLSAATPYLSLAFNSVSRNFKCLKRAISDQLRHVTKALGEDFLSPNTGASSSRGDTSTSRMRYKDQSFQRHKSGGANVGYFEPQQHVWRPQRGLPERSVAILRAWLFDHFLHPYPTDTDKHMLATQTGLTRSQVSNWFINARVRVWKPMVEEIHMLETKGLAETNRTYVNDVDGKSTDGSTSQPDHEQPSNNVAAASCTVNKQLKCSGEGLNAEQWNQEKRSRVEFQAPTSMDGAVMNFLPYQRSGIEIGGIGAVSLTLGLRHGVENAQQQQTQLQQHENQLRRQFGGQMIHDFVG